MVPPTTLQARKQALVRDAIWDAAIDLFSTQGFEPTTIEEIARAAGVSRRSFFRYFSSKNDLMGQGILSYGTLLSDAIANCPADLPPLAALRQVVAGVSETVASNPRSRTIIGIAQQDPPAREALLTRMVDLEQEVRKAYRKRLGTDSGDDLTPRLLAGLTLSLLDISLQLWFDHGHREVSVATTQVFTRLTQLFP